MTNVVRRLRGGMHVLIRTANRARRLLSVFAVSTCALLTVQSTPEPLADEAADPDKAVVYRHYV